MNFVPSESLATLRLNANSFWLSLLRLLLTLLDVAVSGLPLPRKDHAAVMCKFANDCSKKMKVLVRKLETTLGPETADLGLRVGLHSGPVTAGVLRGEKGRFQLFGDTMNT